MTPVSAEITASKTAAIVTFREVGNTVHYTITRDDRRGGYDITEDAASRNHFSETDLEAGARLIMNQLPQR